MDRQSLHRKIRELEAVPHGEVHLIVLLEAYVSRHRDDIFALLAYADALRVIGRHSEAEALLEPAYEASKGSKARAELAMSLAMAAEPVAPGQAEIWFSRYLDLKKTDAPGWAWILRGANFARQERFDDAIACYKTALNQNDVDRDEALKNIALAYRAKGDYSEAITFLRRSSMVSKADSEIALLQTGLQDIEQTKSIASTLD